MTVNAQDPTLTINATALEECLAVINARPDLHRQDTFVIGPALQQYQAGGLEAMSGPALNRPDLNGCGTACCLAGWAGLLFAEQYGYRASRQGKANGTHWLKQPSTRHTGMRWRSEWEVGLRVYGVGEVAREIFGITRKQSDVLFSAPNSRAMLALMVKDLINTGDLAGDIGHYGELAHPEARTMMEWSDD